MDADVPRCEIGGQVAYACFQGRLHRWGTQSLRVGGIEVAAEDALANDGVGFGGEAFVLDGDGWLPGHYL